MSGFRGRFAPSPTGPLHAGSLVAALASWLDARAHAGQWLVRIEDVDTLRCIPGCDTLILDQLAACGLFPDEAPVRQSQRGALYQFALDRLIAAGMAYPCACSRKDVAHALAARGLPHGRNTELIYPGTCRAGMTGREPRAWRFLTRAATGVSWTDRRLGRQQQDVERTVGDFVLKRADGQWAYQLAVVVDDAAQGISHVVRGEDLADNTARQILLQRALDLATPAYLHTPPVLGVNGEKLSKQNGALSVSEGEPHEALRRAGLALDLSTDAATQPAWLAQAVRAWAARWPAEPQGQSNNERPPQHA